MMNAAVSTVWTIALSVGAVLCVTWMMNLHAGRTNGQNRRDTSNGGRYRVLRVSDLDPLDHETHFRGGLLMKTIIATIKSAASG